MTPRDASSMNFSRRSSLGGSCPKARRCDARRCHQSVGGQARAVPRGAGAVLPDLTEARGRLARRVHGADRRAEHGLCGALLPGGIA